MEMSDLKWIKITTDVFDTDSKLFALESLQDGYLIELVWFKLLVLTGKLNNNGLIVNSAKIPYTDEMLSQALRIELGTLQRALELFQRLDMIEVVDDAYMISNWLKHQNGDRLDDIRKSHAEAQKRYREKQKNLALEKKSDVTRDVTSDVKNDIIPSYSYSYSNSISNIVNYLNNKTNSNYKSNTKNTVKHIKARLDEGYTEEDFYQVIDVKYSEWHGTDFEKFLRPDTLFGTKFESYLNQKSQKKKSQLELLMEGIDDD